MSYAEEQRHLALIKTLDQVARQLTRIADALEADNNPELAEAPAELRRPISYRDALRQIAPERVGNEWHGGAMGCPGGYFQGAPRGANCGPGALCTDCWNAEYKHETVLQPAEPY